MIDLTCQAVRELVRLLGSACTCEATGTEVFPYRGRIVVAVRCGLSRVTVRSRPMVGVVGARGWKPAASAASLDEVGKVLSRWDEALVVLSRLMLDAVASPDA